MSATFDFGAAEGRRSRALALACLALVLAGHAAVLGLLPQRPEPRASLPPVAVRLIVPTLPPEIPVEKPQVQPPPKPTPPPVRREPPRAAAAERTDPRPDPVPAQPAPLATESAAAPGAVAPSEARPAPEPQPAPKPKAEPGIATIPARFDAAYLDNPKPEYPRLSRRLGEQGTVLLDVYVDAEGRAVKIEVNRSSGSPRLDLAARETVGRWRFVPARQGERPVAAWIGVPITFKLE